MKKENEFLNWFQPIIDALKELGGAASAKDVTDRIIEKHNITQEQLNAVSKTGVKIFYNQVAWARQYLVYEGLLDSSKRGVWSLTEKAYNVHIDKAEAKDITKKWVKYHVERRKSLTAKSDIEASSILNYWTIALGEGGKYIDECIEQSIIAVGWDYLGDLNQYNSKDEINIAINTHDNKTGDRINDSLCLWDFSRTIKQGDIIVVKQGNFRIRAVGKVISDYIYDQERTYYKHTRKVEWLKIGDWTINEQFALKTLTNITSYPSFVELIMNTINSEIIQKEYPIYTKEDALKDLFLEDEYFERILRILKRKKNIILQGSPGVGKTFVAKRIAYSYMGYKDESRIEMIQFHQAYSYEDFIQGYKPTDSGTFMLKNGVFYDFCQRAKSKPDKDFFFIIDEINRGNLSKIFGELMMLIEADKRGEGYSLSLTYSNDNDRFYVPENVHIIGTMNTADRSLAIVDYALRRRFSFVSIEPAFSSFKLSNYLENCGINHTLLEKITRNFTKLNNAIQNDHRLGAGFKIGHSYFTSNINSENQEQWYKNIIDMEIEPLIREYWFDDEETAEKQLSNLK